MGQTGLYVRSRDAADDRPKGAGPKELRIELTHDCALRCRHCSARSEAGSLVELPCESVVKTIRDFVMLGGERVILTGGEPLVYPELLGILQSANEIGIRPILFSSGTVHGVGGCRALNEAEIMRVRPLVSSMVFSLYSGSCSDHEHITQVQGSFPMCLETIQECARHGIPTEVNFVPMKPNCLDVLDVVRLARGLEVKKVHVLRFVPHGRGEENIDELLPSPAEYEAFASLIETARAMFPRFLDVGAAFRGIVPGVMKPCSATGDKLVVTADGFVFPCDGFKNLVERDGEWNIIDRPLSEIYDKSPLLRCLTMASRYRAAHERTHRLSGFCPCVAQRLVARRMSTRSNENTPLAVS